MTVAEMTAAIDVSGRWGPMVARRALDERRQRMPRGAGVEEDEEEGRHWNGNSTMLTGDGLRRRGAGVGGDLRR
ncbi:hypothetical protein E2562_000699 [Oryza meyeriana var. granulata]|uniref:DUF834 domain-containing protein n=1 Tax=Oryza meyeriana var. granulata TaxID=110450 RepID=A0A6G1DU89_9ORYZ|nr:hypothetical protein E2562_000699 [Oryza meyeriana var. granulata]